MAEHYWESRSGARLEPEPVRGYDVPPDVRLVLVLAPFHASLREMLGDWRRLP